MSIKAEKKLLLSPQNIDPKTIIAGVDEAGRGPLAGPVVAAAVILPDDFPKEIALQINDSKKMSENKRIELSQSIYQYAHVGVCSLPAKIIDRLNIRNATLEAMARAVNALAIEADMILVDGKDALPGISYSHAIIGGDAKYVAIAAASIVAKTARDMSMLTADLSYPNYGFAQHKGYPTKAHREALKDYGATKLHRQSYKPVRDALI